MARSGLLAVPGDLSSERRRVLTSSSGGGGGGGSVCASKYRSLDADLEELTEEVRECERVRDICGVSGSGGRG